MFELKAFQAEALYEILDHITDLHQSNITRKIVVLDSPTGSGKTAMSLTAVCHELRKASRYRKFDTVLVLTPSRDIREGYEMETVRIPDHGNVVGWEANGKGMTVVVSPNEAHWVREIRQHLTHPRQRFKGSVLVATHAAGVCFFKSEDFEKINWERVLIVIDEAHHVSVDYEDDEKELEDLDVSETPEKVKFEETKLGLLCKKAGGLGATILMTSATSFRANRMEQVYPKDARLVKVPYDVYARELGAPNNLHIELVGPGDEHAMQDLTASTEKRMAGAHSSYHDGDKKEIEGELSEEDALRLAQRVVKDGLGSDGKVKSKAFIKVSRLFRTKSDGTREPTKTVERITRALEQMWDGVAVEDGTGSDAKNFLQKLEEERATELYEDSTVDVFIVCGRAKEGTDWKFCSHFYYLGLIGNIPYMIQVLGRATRSKRYIPDYPDELRDTATLTMFVPNMTEKLASEVRTKWHSGALLAACFIHSHEIASHFIDHVALRIRTRSHETHKGSRTQWIRLMSKLNQCLPTPDEMALADQAIGKLELEFQDRENRDPSIPEIIEDLMASDLPPRIKTAGVLLQIGTRAKDPKAEKDLEKAVLNFVDKVLKVTEDDPDDADFEADLYNQYLLSAFTDVASKWDHVTSMRLEGQLELESQIRGQELEPIAQDFRSKILPKPPYKQIVRAVYNWYEEYGNAGVHLRGDISENLGRPLGTYSGATLRRDLKQGLLPGQPDYVRSFHQLLHEEDIGR